MASVESLSPSDKARGIDKVSRAEVENSASCSCSSLISEGVDEEGRESNNLRRDEEDNAPCEDGMCGICCVEGVSRG